MGAIAGTQDGDGAREGVREMLEALRHRGPDTCRILNGQGFVLGARASSHSPARGDGTARDGDATLVLDGELYNARSGHATDADVAMALFRAHGRDFAGRLDGLFACAVLDGNGDLILARDGMGLRPLYWGHDREGRLCFASELKALTGRSQDVRELPPGTLFSPGRGPTGFEPYAPAVSVPDTPEEAAAALRAAVLNAVERRLADGAVGACLLSGGLDSSIIAAAVKALGADMPLLTVGADAQAPDIENARLVARHLGMKHEVRFFTGDEIEARLPTAVRCLESYDEDCVSGCLSNLFAAELAHRTTRCVLSGEGADELFGGYHLLKDVAGDSARAALMEELLKIAYNTALQRLDRAMMAFALHYRTPFLDAGVAAFARRLPVSWKIHRGADGRDVEKWILREAFRDWLPAEIVDRAKLRFSRGTGVDALLERRAAGDAAPGGADRPIPKTDGGPPLNSATEERLYREFKRWFPDPCFERLVGRWDPGKRGADTAAGTVHSSPRTTGPQRSP